MPLHLYGAVRSDHPIRPDLRGVGEPPGPVSIIESGALGVAVSPVAADIVLTEADAERHLDVLVDLLTDGPVVPLRFGTMAPDADAVISEVLTPAAAQLEASLDAIDGLVELQLVVKAREDDELAAVVAEHPELRAKEAYTRDLPIGERIALGELIDAQLRDRRRRRFELIDERLEPHCRAVRDISGNDPTASRVAVLVPAAHLDDFDVVVGQLFNDLGPGYESEYIGPLPAADFVGIGSGDAQSYERWGWTRSEDSAGSWGW
jgi:hypothetical protein